MKISLLLRRHFYIKTASWAHFLSNVLGQVETLRMRCLVTWTQLMAAKCRGVTNEEGHWHTNCLVKVVCEAAFNLPTYIYYLVLQYGWPLHKIITDSFLTTTFAPRYRGLRTCCRSISTVVWKLRFFEQLCTWRLESVTDNKHWGNRSWTGGLNKYMGVCGEQILELNLIIRYVSWMLVICIHQYLCNNFLR